MSQSDLEQLFIIEIEHQKRTVLNNVDVVESILKTVRFRIEHDQPLNSLGELQGSGTMLDAAIATLAAYQQSLKHYYESKGRQ